MSLAVLLAFVSRESDPLIWLGVGTVFFVGFVAGVFWGRGKLQKWLSKSLANKTKAIESIHLRRLGLQQIIVLVRGLLHFASVVLVLIATIAWILFALTGFETTQPFAEDLMQGVQAKGRDLGHGLLAALP
ncbi:MAG: hypothetical protein HOH58_06610, partial [Opitutaceae bacterium]|nr:hypothetical protein [Opitutaceae bacterium]